MKKMISVIITLTALVGFLMGQTYVPPGDNTLSLAILMAADGDVLQLVPNAEYTESTDTYFGKLANKSITIEVEGDGTDKAILKFLTVPTVEDPVAYFRLGDQSSLTLRGLKFDGTQNGTAAVSSLIKFYVGETPVPTNVNNIRVENCHIHDLTEEVIIAGNSMQKYNLVVDSTFVENTVVERTWTAVYYKYCGADYIKIQHCTFNTIDSYGIRVAGPVESGQPEHTPTVDIDHTTWYDIGGATDPREIIQLEKGPNLNPWTITNSIFVYQTSKTRTAINLKENPGPTSADDTLSTVTNVCWWDVGVINFRGHAVADTIEMDPAFADAVNGDFTLPVGSPLLTYGEYGNPIGDMRWATNFVSTDDEPQLVKSFSLEQNYPNPFNPSTEISFEISNPGLVKLTVYDILGSEIRQLVSENIESGRHSVEFDGSGLASGIFIYRLESAGKSITKKMMLIK